MPRRAKPCRSHAEPHPSPLTTPRLAPALPAAAAPGRFAATDVTVPDQVDAALDMIESYGDGAVNTVVNCAGICPGVRTYHPKKGPHPIDVFSKTLEVSGRLAINIINILIIYLFT